MQRRIVGRTQRPEHLAFGQLHIFFARQDAAAMSEALQIRLQFNAQLRAAALQRTNVVRRDRVAALADFGMLLEVECVFRIELQHVITQFAQQLRQTQQIFPRVDLAARHVQHQAAVKQRRVVLKLQALHDSVRLRQDLPQRIKPVAQTRLIGRRNADALRFDLQSIALRSVRRLAGADRADAIAPLLLLFGSARLRQCADMANVLVIFYFLNRWEQQIRHFSLLFLQIISTDRHDPTCS